MNALKNILFVVAVFITFHCQAQSDTVIVHMRFKECSCCDRVGFEDERWVWDMDEDLTIVVARIVPKNGKEHDEMKWKEKWRIEAPDETGLFKCLESRIAGTTKILRAYLLKGGYIELDPFTGKVLGSDKKK